MKTYIFFTIDILGFGGIQMYIASKADTLEKMGWKVKILYSSYSSKKCEIPALEKYRNGLIQGLNVPPFKWPKHIYKQILNKSIDYIGESDDEVIIESHNDSYAIWAEIIAEKLKAKHIIVLLNEIYRGKRKYYDEKLDFYRFKFQRMELGGSQGSLSKLFGEDISSTEAQKHVFRIDENPVKDYQSDIVDSITRKDWNICVISRPEKGYIPNILEGIISFSKAHPCKQIQCLLMGEKEGYVKLLPGVDIIPHNLSFIFLGMMIPIPRSLFSKVDVFIAGAGSGRAAAYEGALVIVPDASNFMANGLLGYDVVSANFNEEGNQQTFFDKALERVFVDRVQEKMTFSYPREGVEKCVAQNFDFIKRSERTKEYYGEEKLLENYSRIEFSRIAAYYGALVFPNCFGKMIGNKAGQL